MKHRAPGTRTVTPTGWPIHVVADTAVEAGLMPYEAAAKAIFVRANGLAAYCKTTGVAECGD